MKVFQQNGIDPNSYSDGFADTQQGLPWDHIHIGVDRAYLVKERSRAVAGEITIDCRKGACSGCGVCDFNELKPISFHDFEIQSKEPSPACEPRPSDTTIKYLIQFKKMARARFLGHLEMAKVFIRSLRRANIPLTYSNGFHPLPKISFKDTLPAGMQSQNEQMVIGLSRPIKPAEIVSRLQEQLPGGFEISGCFPLVEAQSAEVDKFQNYHVELKDGFFNPNDLDWFLEQQTVNIERKSKRGKFVVIDLKKAIAEIQLLGDQHARMSLGRDNNHMVRPAQVLKSIFNLSESQILTAIITKRKTNHV